MRRRGRWGGGEGGESGEEGHYGVEHIVLPLLGESVRHMGSSFY